MISPLLINACKTPSNGSAFLKRIKNHPERIEGASEFSAKPFSKSLNYAQNVCSQGSSSAQKPPLISLHNIVKIYPMRGLYSNILNELSLTVNEGELLAIVGASGSGKSTLMNIIGLLDKADSGDYMLGGVNIAGLNEDDLASLRNQSIGFVFQQFNLLPRLSAKQNVALPLTYRNLPVSEIKERVMHALACVGMQALADHRPTQLSGGQQQRVAIARALVSEPCVILADEPTGALDSRTSSEVMNLFLTLHQQGRTLIIVTHDEQIANQCARRITLVDGQIITESML